jgi:hypothetical protein
MRMNLEKLNYHHNYPFGSLNHDIEKEESKREKKVNRFGFYSKCHICFSPCKNKNRMYVQTLVSL